MPVLQRRRAMVPFMLSVHLLALASLEAQQSRTTESFLNNLPAGVAIESSFDASAAQLGPIGQKLGGTLAKLNNSVLVVHGRKIQVNEIRAQDEEGAQRIHASLLKLKPFPFCQRKGLMVVEYVGRDLDQAIAFKTSYELGLLPKPKQVRYRVEAELGAIDQADYMACNPLFNHFLQWQAGQADQVRPQIAELAQKFQFGSTLVLRGLQVGEEKPVRSFQPPPKQVNESIATARYQFEQLPQREGVPYVKATLEVTVDESGLRAVSAPPAASLTAATPFWPADDAEVVRLAKQITQGKTSNGAKAQAILEWLTPGKNIKYSGQTGSRWGTARVLSQKFGHCWDFSDCFVTLARAAGIPARQVAGWLYGSSGHVWAEFYRDGKGWQQVDPTGGGQLRCGIYHIPYFTSEEGEMPVLYLAMPKIEPVN